MGYAIKDPNEFTWNPGLKIPRNGPCPCKSGQKFKKCCLPKMSRVVDIGTAQKAAPIVRVVRNAKKASKR